MVTKRRHPLFRLAAGGAVAFVALAVVGSVSRPSSASDNLPASSFATSISVDGATYAAIPMGDLGQLLNTFWQLFRSSAASPRWTLVTPPGIADNGGLVIEGGSPAALTVAIRPSNLLTFTAVAVEGAHSTWSNGGLIPGALVGAPTAFVGTGAASYAAVKGSGGAVLRSRRGASAWTRIATSASLTTLAGGSCLVSGVQALATNAGLPLYAGTTCLAGDRAGIFAFAGTSWRFVGPKLGTLGGRSSRSVLVLSATASGVDSLIATSSGATTRLVVAHSSSRGSSWLSSSPLRIPSSARIVASGTVGSTGAYVVWQQGGAFAAVSGADGRWSILPKLPDGALTLALPQGTAGAIDALGGHRSTFLAWQLDASTGRWRQTEAYAVPILYGSSS